MNGKTNEAYNTKMPTEEAGKTSCAKAENFPAPENGVKQPANPVKPEVRFAPAEGKEPVTPRNMRRILALSCSIAVLCTLFIFIVLNIYAAAHAGAIYDFFTAWSRLLFKADFGCYIFLVVFAGLLAATLALTIKNCRGRANTVLIIISVAVILFTLVFSFVYYYKKYDRDELASVSVREWVNDFTGFDSKSYAEYSSVSAEYEELLIAVRNKNVDTEKWSSVKAAHEVYRQISNIGEITPVAKAKIDLANDGYEKLTAIQKSYVGNASVLFNATERYAYLADLKYTLVMDPNGGEDKSVNAGELGYWQDYAIPAVNFTREHYDFMGWALDSDATHVKYSVGDSVASLADIDGATVNLYAVWRGKPVTVHLDVGGHSLPIGTKYLNDVDRTVYYGDKVPQYGFSLPYTMHDSSNYYAYGWFTQDGDMVYHYENGIVPNVEGVTDEEGRWILTEDIRLVAHWTTK